MSLLGNVHGKYVHNRRVRQLCRHFSEIIPQNANVLDVGCGDGLLASLIKTERADISIEGIDIMVREKIFVPIKEFDGEKIPYADNHFDAVMFVDVLHHTNDAMVLLKEAKRVAKNCILIKDHSDEGFMSNATLRFMDWVGNKPHGVVLPYNYWKKHQWNQAFQELGARVSARAEDLELYPAFADKFFGRKLHFVARLDLTEKVNE